MVDAVYPQFLAMLNDATLLVDAVQRSTPAMVNLVKIGQLAAIEEQARQFAVGFTTAQKTELVRRLGAHGDVWSEEEKLRLTQSVLHMANEEVNTGRRAETSGNYASWRPTPGDFTSVCDFFTASHWQAGASTFPEASRFGAFIKHAWDLGMRHPTEQSLQMLTACYLISSPIDRHSIPPEQKHTLLRYAKDEIRRLSRKAGRPGMALPIHLPKTVQELRDNFAELFAKVYDVEMPCACPHPPEVLQAMVASVPMRMCKASRSVSQYEHQFQTMMQTCMSRAFAASFTAPSMAAMRVDDLPGFQLMHPENKHTQMKTRAAVVASDMYADAGKTPGGGHLPVMRHGGKVRWYLSNKTILNVFIPHDLAEMFFGRLLRTTKGSRYTYDTHFRYTCNVQRGRRIHIQNYEGTTLAHRDCRGKLCTFWVPAFLGNHPK